MDNKPIIVGHHYDRISLTVWEVWSNGEAYCSEMSSKLTRLKGGLWYPTMPSNYAPGLYRGKGMEEIALLTPGGQFMLRDTTIISGLEKVYMEYVCKMIIEE